MEYPLGLSPRMILFADVKKASFQSVTYKQLVQNPLKAKAMHIRVLCIPDAAPYLQHELRAL
jgi:hypothetical protein